MLKSKYFIEAIQAGKFKKLDWIISILSVTELANQGEINEGDEVPYELVSNLTKTKMAFFDPVTKAYVDIDDAKINEPMFYRKAPVTIPGGTINLPPEIKTLDTTVGNVLINAIVFFHPLGKKVGFFNGDKDITKIKKISPKDVTKRVLKLHVPPKEYKTNPDKYVSVAELRAWMDAVTWMGDLAPLTNPTASEASMGVHPDVIKLRDELYKKHASELGNPAVQAAIEAELVAKDKETMKDDPSFDFYYEDKHWATARKKQYITIGLAGAIHGDPNMITESLSDGIDINKMPAYANSIRHTSYSRGHLTALGGELVKYIYRVTQNIKITEHDCGDTHGLPDFITPDLKSQYIGRYVVSGKTPILITEDNVDSFVNKDLFIRSPAYCKTIKDNYCEICMGLDLSKTPNALHTAAAQPGSVMMNASMKAMHGKISSTLPFDYLTAIT